MPWVFFHIILGTILRQQAKGETQPGRPDNEKGQDSDLDDLEDDFSDLEC